MKQSFFLIDGNSLINRAFFALPRLTNAEGVHTGAIYGFISILSKLIEEYKPDYLCVAFDLKGPTFRHEQYEAYKGTRAGMPTELAQQMQPIKEFIQAMGISKAELPGYEADDIIGTLSLDAEDRGMDVFIVTGDKDSFQLASPTTKILYTKKGISELDIYDEEKVKERYQLTPTQFIDLKGLMGDPSDNIPGIPGIGEKTGIKLLTQYGSMEGVLSHIDELKGSLKKKVEENVELAIMSKKLATIERHIPMEYEFEDFALKTRDHEALKTQILRFELHSLNSRLLGETGETKEEAQLEEFHIKILDDINLFQSLISDRDTEIYCKFFQYEGNIVTQKLYYGYVLVGEKFFRFTEDQVLSLKEVWESSECSINGYHLKEDYLVLKPYSVALKKLIFDIKIAEYLINPDSAALDIATISQKYRNRSIKSEELLLGKGKGKKAYTEIPLIELDRYAYDLLSTVKESKKSVLTIIDEHQMNDVFEEIEMPLCSILADMEFEGIYVDRETLLQLQDQFTTQIGELETVIYEQAGETFNVNSPKQLGHILFDVLNLPVVKKTKTGYSTDIKVLERLYDQHPIIDNIMTFRQISKLKSTYVDGMLSLINPITHRLHTTFNQTLAATGRLSSTNPNLQNIPIRLEQGRELRKIFQSKKGYSFVDADYSQIELRVLAHIAEEENMISAFASDIDIHTKTASEVFGVTLNEVTSEMRSAAKAVNFGIIYGISDFGLSNNLGISIQDAKKYIELYLDRYPKIKDYMDNTVKSAEERGYTQTISGRIRFIPELQSRNFAIKNQGKRLAMNAPIQGSAADIIKIAMIKVDRYLKENQLDAKLLLQVHDELIIEANDSLVTKLEVALEQLMEQAVSLKTTLSTEVKSGKSWYDTK